MLSVRQVHIETGTQRHKDTKTQRHRDTETLASEKETRVSVSTCVPCRLWSECLFVLLLQAARVAGASGRGQLNLANTHELGRHLNTLVFTSKLEALFECELA